MGAILLFLNNYGKTIGIVLALVLSAVGGWKLNTYYTGYQLSIDQKVQKQVDTALERIEQNSAKNLIDTQKLIKDNATKIVETKVPVIVERKVYQNICLDEDGVNVLRELKKNSQEGRKMIK